MSVERTAKQRESERARKRVITIDDRCKVRVQRTVGGRFANMAVCVYVNVNASCGVRNDDDDDAIAISVTVTDEPQ